MESGYVSCSGLPGRADIHKASLKNRSETFKLSVSGFPMLHSIVSTALATSFLGDAIQSGAYYLKL